MRHKILFIIPLLTLFTSCSFNKIFLYPYDAPPIAKPIIISTEVDTTAVIFAENAYQPTFIINGKDTLDLNYTIESVVYESVNGNQLNGWFLKPKNQTAEYTLLHFHGNTGFLLSQFGIMTPLLEKGFQIFMFDYSGFGFSTGKATRKNVWKDAMSSLDYIIAREEVKNTKLIIYGQSLGGHLSAKIAAQREQDIDGLVIEGAFSSHKDIAADKSGIAGRILVKETYSAKKAIKNFHKPLLVIHSIEDKTCPFTMGEKIYAFANQPKEFYSIEKCHICGPIYYSEEIAEKIKSLF